MKIIDTNGLNYILANDIQLKNDYYLAPDIVEEAEMTQIIHSKNLPHKILKIDETIDFDEGIYLKHYQVILNKYGGRSFFNMTGFGDISILAVLLMLMSRKQMGLFPETEVYTADKDLINKIRNELGTAVAIFSCESIT